MRFVVYGAGAIGGVVGGRLHQHGHEVVLIARGSHLAALRSGGLVLRDPAGEARLDVRVVEHPGRIRWRDGDVVLLAVKSQDTERALTDLATTGPANLPVLCLQNGVRNEPEALRRFEHVYGVLVACPAVHLEPGVVEAYSTPVTGILDVGRYPRGVDSTAEPVVAAFNESGFDSRAVPDIVRWKWRKLLVNLGNAIEVACGRAAARGPIGDRALAEGEACLAAAGIEAATAGEDLVRRGDLLHVGQVAGHGRPGSSSWQSLVRGSAAIETDYLNGEIVLLGRLHGIPTPVNGLAQSLVNHLVATGAEPGSAEPEEFERLLEAGKGP